MLKKVLSLVLISLFLFQAIHFNICSSHALWGFGSDNKARQGVGDVCKNDYFEDVIEARNCGIKFIKSNMKRTFSKINIGKKKSTDLWMWDYVQINDAVSQLTEEIKQAKGAIAIDKVISKCIYAFKALFETNDEIIQSAVNEWTKETKVLNLKPTLEDKSGAKSTISVTQADRKRSNILWSVACGGVGMVVSALVPGLRTIVWGSKLLSLISAGVVGAGSGYVGVNEIRNIKDEHAADKAIQQNRAIVKSYSLAFEKILNGITNGMWENGDMLVLDINHDTDHYQVDTEFLDEGIHYSKEAKEKFTKTFDNLKQLLIETISKNKETDTEEL